MAIHSQDLHRNIENFNPQSPDWQGILSDILARFDCSTGTIHTLDPATNTLKIQAYQGIPEFLLPKMSVVPIGKGMAGIAAERKAPVQMCNLQTDESGVARPSAKETQVEGSMALPMLHEGQLHGVLGVAKPVAYEFTDDETASLMQLGAAMAKFIADK